MGTHGAVGSMTVLVLTQREGEILQIGDDVQVHIKRIKGNWVRLAIDAPREVALKRIPVDEARRAADDQEESG